MASLSEIIAAAKASADAVLARIQTDVTTLRGEIAAMTKRAETTGATTNEMNEIKNIKTKVDSLDPTLPNVLP